MALAPPVELRASPADAAGTGRAPPRADTHEERDPFAAVLFLGARAHRAGLAFGLGVALMSHGAMAVRALTMPVAMARWAAEAHERLRLVLWTLYDIEVPEPPARKEPLPSEAEPEPPAPEPAAARLSPPPPHAPAPRPASDPYDEPPPAPGKAGAVLTAKEDPEEPVDLSDQGFVVDPAGEVRHGWQARDGTATSPVTSEHARVGGVPGGRGIGPAPPPPPPGGPDLSRPPALRGGTAWDCPFPPEADAEQINAAVVKISVVVRPDGSPRSVAVLEEPGHGFGRAARTCAMGRRYEPGLDREGRAVTMTMPPIVVRFSR